MEADRIIATRETACKGGCVRIIGGMRRGRRLLDWEETGIRPVRDFVRSALFSIVADFVADAVCLDLYAGTGSLGFEAISRGAARCTFVDGVSCGRKVYYCNTKLSPFRTDIRTCSNRRWPIYPREDHA